MRKKSQKLKHCFFIVLLCTMVFKTFAQNGVAINTTGTSADPSAILDLSNIVNKGLLLPQVNSTASISNPQKGLVVYQTNSPAGIYCNTGTSTAPIWILLTSTPALNGTGYVKQSGTTTSYVSQIPLGGGTDVTGILPVANGGTGVASTTVNGVLLGGATTTGAFQNAGTGTLSGQVLTSNGAGATPIWQNVSSSIITLGQSSTSYFGTTQQQITTTGTYTQLSGLITPGTGINVPANFTVLITTSGGTKTTGNGSGTFYSDAQIGIFVDNVLLTTAGNPAVQNVVSPYGSFDGLPIIVNWSFSASVSFTTTANHIFSVRALHNNSNGVTAEPIVNGNAASVLQGVLTVTVLKN